MTPSSIQPCSWVAWAGQSACDSWGQAFCRSVCLVRGPCFYCDCRSGFYAHLAPRTPKVPLGRELTGMRYRYDSDASRIESCRARCAVGNRRSWLVVIARGVHDASGCSAAVNHTQCPASHNMRRESVFFRITLICREFVLCAVLPLRAKIAIRTGTPNTYAGNAR
jgi:hypothetical protein